MPVEETWSELPAPGSANWAPVLSGAATNLNDRVTDLEAAGTRALLDGHGAPSSSLGKTDDWYIDVDSGQLYKKSDAVTWVNIASLKGVQGDQGDQGLPGVNAVPAATAVAAYIADPDPDPEANPVPTALSAAYAPITGAAAYLSRDPRMAAFATKLRQRQAVTIALAGDSTGDENSEWFCRAMDTWTARDPSDSLSYKMWNDATQAFDTTVRQAGANKRLYRPFADWFTRTATDLKGSVPPRSYVATWGGAAGSWSLDGASAVFAAANGFSTIGGGVPVGIGPSTLSGALDIDTTAGAADKRLSVGWYRTGTNIERVSLFIGVTTGGAISWGIEGQFGAPPIYALVATGGGAPLVAGLNSNIPFTLNVDGTWNITATLNGVTVTATMTGTQQASVAAMNGGYLNGVGPLGSMCKINSLVADHSVAATTPVVHNIINASKAGSTLQYQLDRLATMYPTDTPIDHLFISSSHNYGATDVPTYLATLDAFIAEYQALHPESAITVAAQNPEVPPASNRDYHRDRCMALPTYAQAHGYGFLNAYSAFRAVAGWSQSLVRADGVHPTASSDFDDLVDPNSGQYVWMTEAVAYLDRLAAAAA